MKAAVIIVLVLVLGAGTALAASGLCGLANLVLLLSGWAGLIGYLGRQFWLRRAEKRLKNFHV